MVPPRTIIPERRRQERCGPSPREHGPVTRPLRAQPILIPQARSGLTDMVVCPAKESDKLLDAQLPTNSKMASQLENCLSHLTEVYGGLKIEQAPAVRCLVAPNCRWVGGYEEILLHCQQCHPDSIWMTGEKTHEFRIDDISKDCYHVKLVLAYGHLFWLHVKNDLSNNHLYAACQHIVMKNEDPHTKFMIRTELCDASRLNCISCSTETRPNTEDVNKIFASQNCAVRSHQRLQTFIHPDNSISFNVSISKIYYYQ